MKIITLHCDYIKFKPLKKALKSAEELSEKEKEETQVNEALVILTAIEKNDSEKEIKEAIESIKKTADEVKTKTLVLYPYAHLSSNLANPEIALKLLKKAETILKSSFSVTRAPFGYYKEFELKCKGHPLSELSKQFGAQAQFPQTINSSEKDEDISHLLNQISRSKLDTSKLKENDHRILGQKLDLFSFNEASPGSVFWHPNGSIIYNELVSFLKNLLDKYDYKEVSTPQILDNKLWKISGHWDHYKNNLFITSYEQRQFGVKPMNCPGAMLIYRTRTKSYKDLPLRLAELGVVHRQELSGVLAGLFRVVKFTQDDAHIFCTEEQIELEIKHILEMIKIIYKDTFKFSYNIELSTRPEKFMGSEKEWHLAEKALESALKKSKIKYKLKKGDGAFYGPKIDVHIKDSLDRSWQTATIQLDMQMPQRFELEYIGKDNSRHTPIVIHRALFGSLERFIGILLEHLNGALPLWLSPTQVRIINFTSRNEKAAKNVLKDFKKEIPSLRIDSDLRNTTVSEKVRAAELLKIPYIIVIGDKEEKSKTLAVRERGSKPKLKVSQKSLLKELKNKIEKRN